MKYIEIAKLIRFVHKEVFMRKVRQMSDVESSMEPEGSIDLGNRYDIRPALIEMHENFTQNWHCNRITEQMKKDYENYLLELRMFSRSYSEEEKKILKGWYNAIKIHLENPTYLEFNLLKVILGEEEDVEKNELEGASYLWFKVGLKFATGEIEENALFKKSAPEIAKDLEIPGGEKYILGTLNNYDNDKNIYKNKKKMRFLFDYCQARNLGLSKDFTKRVKSIITAD